MKRIIAALAVAVTVWGCTNQVDASGRFKTIDTIAGNRACVVVDTQTNVMYAVSIGYYNSGNFTVLVDADGKPLLWGEE